MGMNPFYNTCAWRSLSRHVRFGRALGYCEICGVPHGAIAADGRSVIRLGCAHLNGDLHDLRPENLAAFCPQCHFLYDEFRRVGTLVRKHPELREFLAGGRMEEGKRRAKEEGKRPTARRQDGKTRGTAEEVLSYEVVEEA